MCPQAWVCNASICGFSLWTGSWWSLTVAGRNWPRVKWPKGHWNLPSCLFSFFLFTSSLTKEPVYRLKWVYQFRLEYFRAWKYYCQWQEVIMGFGLLPYMDLSDSNEFILVIYKVQLLISTPTCSQLRCSYAKVIWTCPSPIPWLEIPRAFTFSVGEMQWKPHLNGGSVKWTPPPSKHQAQFLLAIAVIPFLSFVQPPCFLQTRNLNPVLELLELFISTLQYKF